jgi:rod shape determining protein RodA
VFLGRGCGWWKFAVGWRGSSAPCRSPSSHLRDYQRARIDTFLNPESDPLGAGYHIIQSKIALGSGGHLGQGLPAGHARPT